MKEKKEKQKKIPFKERVLIKNFQPIFDKLLYSSYCVVKDDLLCSDLPSYDDFCKLCLDKLKEVQ